MVLALSYKSAQDNLHIDKSNFKFYECRIIASRCMPMVGIISSNISLYIGVADSLGLIFLL